MTTQQVADRYYEMAQQGELEKIQDELYALDAVSVEPANASQLPLWVKGLDAMRQKEYRFYQQMVEEMHGGFCNPPVVSTFHFACAMGMDVTLKGEARRVKEQIGVFEVRDGKIVSEHFFYDDFK
ncbi:SnoaL-like domain-containing protein [Spirosoma soli]|uniref:SnoaL-like domain-containing protein n=1 Tax=Spirosoma soli TaxID=1770529 RepID=A0ABW5MBT8_9BACT